MDSGPASKRLDAVPLLSDDDQMGPTANSLGKRPAQSLSSASTTSTTATRRTRKFARQLLDLVSCPSCSQPYRNPVTLPCGHSTCLPCITRSINEAKSQHASSSKSSHVPPRLPLCSMTVPCSVSGCPRSAIGQGLGSWAGYTASFGPPESTATDEEDSASTGGDRNDGENDAGVLPLDGFVVGAENQSLRLGVIPPQRRSKANIFALSPFPTQDGQSVNQLSLRTDVTLAKTVSVLETFAQDPLSPRSSSSSQRARRPLRGYASARRLHHGNHAGSSSSSSSSSNMLSRVARRNRPGPSSMLARGSSFTDHLVERGRHSPGPRPGATRIAPQFRALLGGSEAGRESATVSGVRATDTDDDDDDDDDGFSDAQLRRPSYTARANRSTSVMSYDQDGDAGDAADHEDYEEEEEEMEPQEDEDIDEDDPEGDDFGGAFARPRQPRGYGEEAERLRRQALQTKYWGKMSPAYNGKWEESGWDTDCSGAVTPAAKEGEASTVAQASNPADAVTVAKLLNPEQLLSDLTDSLECQLCYLLFYEPITTPCGHTFCRTCFGRSLDHSNKCPLCRATMPSFAFFQDHPLNQALMRLLNSQLGAPTVDTPRQSSPSDDGDGSGLSREDLDSLSRMGVFADSKDTHTSKPLAPHGSLSMDQDDDGDASFGLRHLYRQRVEAVEQEARESSTWMPIFVCTLAFPDMPTNLHIFEPRYRLMVRRCLQSPGPPRFGMILPTRSLDPSTPQYGTVLEIKSSQMLLDGRSMLETVGWRRFRLLETGSLDGYTTGRVEYLDDITPQEAEAEEAQARAHNERVAHLRQLQAQRSNDPGMPELMTPTIARDGSAQVHGDSSDPSVVLPPFGDHQPSTAADLQPQPTMAELVASCSSFIELLRTQTAPGLFERILATYGPVPQPLEVDRLSWWLGMVLPIDEHAKSQLMPIRSPRKRLEMIVEWIDKIRESWAPRA